MLTELGGEAKILAATGPGASTDGDHDDGQLAKVIPMPLFDPFAEADKPW